VCIYLRPLKGGFNSANITPLVRRPTPAASKPTEPKRPPASESIEPQAQSRRNPSKRVSSLSRNGPKDAESVKKKAEKTYVQSKQFDFAKTQAESFKPKYPSF
jgi:hypothetical protein